MAMVDDRRSRLNPNAPIFIPNTAFSEVEDFSQDWWDLVKTSPWFRDFWLSQYQEEDFIPSFDGYDFSDLDELPVIYGADQFAESKDKTVSESLNGVENGMDAKAVLKNLNMNLNVSKFSKGTAGPNSPVGPAKHCGKKKLANKCVISPKCTVTRRIHQPR